MAPRPEREGSKEESSWRMGEVERVGIIETESCKHRGHGDQRGLTLLEPALGQRTTASIFSPGAEGVNWWREPLGRVPIQHTDHLLLLRQPEAQVLLRARKRISWRLSLHLSSSIFLFSALGALFLPSEIEINATDI